MDWDRSSKTALMIEWSEPANHGTEINGFLLEMDNGNNSYVQVYNGQFYPDIKSHLVNNLTNGHLYKFRVYAINYNGLSEASDSSQFYVCSAPIIQDAPIITPMDDTQLQIRWDPPIDDGGCKVQGFAVFRDQGSSTVSDIDVEFNSANDLEIRNKPGLNEIVATNWPAGGAG